MGTCGLATRDTAGVPRCATMLLHGLSPRRTLALSKQIPIYRL